MFGYIRPYKPEMKMKHFETYRAVYCGLCKQMGRNFGPLSRMTLSYDLAFLSLLRMSIRTDCAGFEAGKCMLNPFSKRTCCKPNEDVDFASHVAMLLFFYKLKDNIKDSVFFKKIGYGFLYPFAALWHRKAAAKYPALDEECGACMKQQSDLESRRCPRIDEAAEPTAKMMESVFRQISDEPSQQRILSRMGYCLGRWIYLTDAMDDLRDDLKTGNYNPYICAYHIEQADENANRELFDKISMTINLTAGEIASCYNLLSPLRFRPILDNIVYEGFPHTLEDVRAQRKHKKEK